MVSCAHNILETNRMTPFKPLTPESVGTNIREHMVVIPWPSNRGPAARKELSRFKAGLIHALSGGRLPSAKHRRNEGLSIEAACAVIADDSASDAALRAAFMRIGEVVQAEMLRSVALEKRVRELEATLSTIKREA